jgi:LPXTG-motif cell wall-anchored protein
MPRKFLAAVALTAVVSALGIGASSGALAAPGDGTWGTWSATNPLDAPAGRITFGNTAVGGANYTFVLNSGSSTASIDSVSSAGEWFTAETSPGAWAGANGPSVTENVLTLSGAAANATTTIVFDNPVPAAYLTLVISDLDSTNATDPLYSDRVTITATTNSGANLSSSELQGSASGSEVFNFCNVTVNANMPTDCGGTVATAVPVMQTPSATSVYFFGDIAVSSAVGNSAWLAPSAEVKTLTILWSSYAVLSDVRIALAVKQDPTPPTPPSPNLPDTGVDAVAVTLTAGVLGLLGSATLLAVRRRRA